MCCVDFAGTWQLPGSVALAHRPTLIATRPERSALGRRVRVTEVQCVISPVHHPSVCPLMAAKVQMQSVVQHNIYC